MGCLLAVFGGLFPRLGVLIVWLLRPRLVDAAFGDAWFLALLGVIFLPFTTLMYVILYTPGFGIRGWEWFWLGLAVLLDLGQWGASFRQRRMS